MRKTKKRVSNAMSQTVLPTNQPPLNEDMMMNAKYVISCSRKVGACVFLTPEDIVECKSKMLLAFSAALWTADIQRGGYK
jgi:hypothetical protein